MDIRRKLHAALWAARDSHFRDPSQVDDFIASLPQGTQGTYRANTSCVQIETGGNDVILCDAGTGIRDYALSLPADAAPRTYHIFLSHLHWDHIQGFPFFSPAYTPGNRIVLHGFHKETEAVLRQQMEAPCFPVPFDSMQADIEFDIRGEGDSFDLGEVQVRTIRQDHPGGSWGYRFERGGKAIVYSTDAEHAPDKRPEDCPFIDFFRGADILIFDAQYTREQVANEKRNWGHSDHSTAIEIAGRAGVGQLVFFHHEPGYSDAEIEAMFAEALDSANSGARPRPQHLVLAFDGLRLEA